MQRDFIFKFSFKFQLVNICVMLVSDVEFSHLSLTTPSAQGKNEHQLFVILCWKGCHLLKCVETT